MPELRTYRRHEMPRDLAWQIRSFVRIQWPHLAPQGPWWDFTRRDDNPLHFVIVDGDYLISHAAVNWRNVEHAGQTYNVFGLSTVFTYPAYRKTGQAQRAVQAASDYVRESSADLAMLFCGEPLRMFYNDYGWEPMDSARILYGDPSKPTPKDDNLVMMMFVSAKGRAAREIFQRDAIFVGPTTW